MQNAQQFSSDRPAYQRFFLRLAAFWLRWSCMPEPKADAPLVQREKYRRAQTVSIIIFLLQIFVVTSFPAGFSGTNSFLLVLLLFAFGANVAAQIANRMGYVLVAGLLLVLNVEISMSTNILTTPGGLSLAALPLFDLLVIPLVLSASVLPAAFVFVFAAINTFFIVVATLNMPQQPDLAKAFTSAGIGLVSLPISIQIILAFLAFLWVNSANKAISRADRAEQIAKLEHDIAESRQEIAEQKTQLEESIQEIAEALLYVNNGGNLARLNPKRNVLWLIVGPINNLLARMQRLRYVEAETQQMNVEIEQLVYALRAARETHQPLRLPLGQQKTRVSFLYEEFAHLQQARGNAPQQRGTIPHSTRLTK